MGTTDKGKALFVMNAGKTESDITDDSTSFDYGDHATKKTEAYLSTSVNPLFVQNNLQYENSLIGTDSTCDYNNDPTITMDDTSILVVGMGVSGTGIPSGATVASITNSTTFELSVSTTGGAVTNGTLTFSKLVNSANFIEIRKDSHGGSISNDLADKVGNRLYPGNTTLTSFAQNRNETHSFKLKVFDSQVANSETNRKLVYSTSNYPATEEIGLDIENYDYFVLLNPDTVQMGADAVRPHFAKVTRIITFDEFGDGLEFSPPYPTEVPLNTKFEIYKGPAKTATDIVAVSYGLRGDTSSSTPKHDRVNVCSRPTWYFYDERLDEKNQLDYMTKYNATHLRWWGYSTNISITEVKEHAQFAVGSNTVKFITSGSSDTNKLSVGMSLFNASDVYLGNIESISSNDVLLDFARIAVSATTSDFNVKVGKTIQNVIFRTEGKFDNTIPSLGKERLDAVLVDANLTSDDSNSSDFYRWQNAFPKMHRHTANSDTTTATTLDGNLTGPGKYVTFELANFKNNRIPHVIDAIVNNPRNKMSQIGKFSIIDNSGLQHLKVQEEDDLIIQKNIHNDDLKLIAFHGTAARDSSNTSLIVLSDIKKETELRAILSTNDIVEIDGYQYVVNAVNAQSSGTQSFTVKDKKLRTANTWTGSAVAENFTGKTLFLTPYTGVLNTELEPDTEFNYTQSRLNIDGITVEKEKTKLYNARLVNGIFNGHDNKIDYGDRDNKYLKMQDSDRVFYQRSNENLSRFYYYKGAYAVSDTVFTGIVEDVTSSAENGLSTLNIVGRDETSQLLTQTITRDTLLLDDVVHTNVPPTLSHATTLTGFATEDSGVNVNGALSAGAYNSIVVDGTDPRTKFVVGDKIYKDDGTFIGVITVMANANTISLDSADLSTRPALADNHNLHKSVIIDNGQVVETLSGNVNATGYISLSPGGLSDLNVAPKRGGILMNQAGEFVGVVKDTSNNSVLYLFNSPVSTATVTTDLKYYHPYDSSFVNVMTGTKVLASNPNNSGLQGMESTSEQGINFNSGLKLISTPANTTQTITTSKLRATSNEGTYSKDRTLGYDISNVKSLSTNDSFFSFNLANENGVSSTTQDIKTVAKDMFHVVDVQEKAEGTTTMTLAPNMPVVLGRLDSNTSDTRGNTALYFVNSNLDTGGFVHRLADTHVGAHLSFDHVNGGGTTKEPGIYGTKETMRYWDFQRLTPGILSTTYDSIYNIGLTPQKIQGYAIAYGTKLDGTVTTPSTTPTGKPIHGSNTLKGWEYIGNFYGGGIDPDTLVESYDASDSETAYEADIDYDVFEQIDPRATTYELLATGDILPNSKLRDNNIGYHTFSFDEFGVLLESEPNVTGTTNHEKYTGTSQTTSQTENMFEENSIQSATITTNQIRRFGVMRLVEATFDWHFNPVEFDALKKSDEIPLVGYFDYITMKDPTEHQDTGSITVNNSGTITSESVTDTAGDMFYSSNLVGDFPFKSTLPTQVAGINGLVAIKKTDNSSFVSNNAFTISGVNGFTTSGELLKFAGSSSKQGVHHYKVFGTTDYNIESLTTRGGHANLLTDLTQGKNAIRWTDVFIARPSYFGTNFKYALLQEDSGDGSDTYNPHNIILPLIVEEQSANGTNRTSRTKHPFSIDGFTGYNHISRVICGLSDRTFATHGSNFGVGDKFGHGNSAAIDEGSAHPYAGCIALFKDVRSSAAGVKYELMSSPLQLDSHSNYTGYISTISGENDHDQHTRNCMIQEYGTNNFLAMLGTKTKDVQYLQNLDDSNHDRLFENTTTNTALEASGVTLNDGGGINANSTTTLTVDGKDATDHFSVGDIVFDESSVLIGVVASLVDDEITLVANNAIAVSDNENLKKHVVPISTRLRVDDHNSLVNSSKGTKVDSAQLLLKPTLRLGTGQGVTYSNSNKTATFVLDELNYVSNGNPWLSYMPDLTGHYIVSEETTLGVDITETQTKSSPKFISKITSHVISTAPSGFTNEQHTITFDRAIDTSTNGNDYRLMRPAETTFDSKRDNVEFNIMDDTGLRGDVVVSDFRDGSTSGVSDKYREGVFSMYLLVDIDHSNTTGNQNKYLEKRTGTDAIAGFTNGESIDVFVTDGINSQRTLLNVSTTRKKGGGAATENILSFTFDGTLDGNGVVSVGGVFDITLGKRPQLQNPTRCHIGTTYSVSSQLEKEVEKIVKEANLDYDNARSFANPTGMIVNSGTTSSTSITCTENVTGISAGDVLFSFDGHLIGEVANGGISNAVITLTKKYFTPLQYDELVKINKKTFVTNIKFNNENMYSAVNSLISKRGLDYTIKNGSFITRNIEDTSILRKHALSYKESSRLIKVGSNKSMFDKANKIIVIGDRVQYELEQPTKKQTRAIKVVDSTIKTRVDAETKAVELMSIYSGETRKINVEVQKKGLELIEAGDIIRMNFPNHNIPVNDYIVFEIENVLSGTLKLQVGTFDKTIAERLSELSSQQSGDSTVLLGRDAEINSSGKFLFDAIKLKNISLSYTITGSSNALSRNSNMGFDDLVGFTEEVGFEHSVVTKKSYRDRFYEQEDYT